MRKVTEYRRKKCQGEPFFRLVAVKQSLVLPDAKLPGSWGIEMMHDGRSTQPGWRLGRKMWPKTIAILGVLGCFYLLSSTSLVQAQSNASEQDRLFQQMLRNPKNLDVTFAYVKVATDNGDYEAAIGALERVLFYQPGLARVKYELGSL
jgi:hypothetical protein